MNLLVNNEAFTLTDNATLLELMRTLQFGEKGGIAVAVNNAVIVRTAWQNHALRENDSVTIIHATQGG